MGTEHDTIVWVASCRLRDNVDGKDRVHFGVDVGDRINALSLLKLLQNWLSFFAREAKCGNVIW